MWVLSKQALYFWLKKVSIYNYKCLKISEFLKKFEKFKFLIDSMMWNYFLIKLMFLKAKWLFAMREISLSECFSVDGVKVIIKIKE